MEEQLLHFIWHRQLFVRDDLLTTTGQAVAILHSGTPNHDQGPDFLQCRIRIGDQLWAGHVEIHVRSSAWYLHTHDHDSHYNNVILHVVWQEDQPVYTQDGYRIPCIELAGRVEVALLDRYRHLMNNEEWIPCASALTDVSVLVRTAWLDRLMAERLEAKTEAILRVLKDSDDNWEQTFYIMLARQLGAPANSDAMEMLASRVPLHLLRRHGDRPDQIEAILFGTAGMLGRELTDPYPVRMKNEFDFLKKKYALLPMQALQWRFMRMRPPHFPTMRIAQLAALIHAMPFFVSLLEAGMYAAEWMTRLSVQPLDAFWKTHYHFTAVAPGASGRLGVGTVGTLLINVVAPVLFLYGKHQGRAEMKEAAIRLLSELPSEKNAIVTRWQRCGWIAADAGQSQALLHLKKQYCDTRRCLHCAVGMQVLK